MGTVNNFGNVLLAAGSNTIDVQSLLNAAMASASAPLNLLEQQQATIQNQSVTLQSIQNDISALSTATSSLSSTNGGVSALQATSSDSNVLSASADSTATAQNHSITVNSLATTSTYYTNAVASGSTTIGTGSFALSVGSNAPVTITVDSTNNTLAGVASSINSKNLGVTASVVNDANGARLALVSNTTGASSNIGIASNTTGLTFNNAVSGSNASLVVDGIPISSASNTITGVIPGVTLNIASAAPSTTVNVSVSPDDSAAQTAVNSFVSSWNKVIQDLNAQFTVGAGGTAAQPLESDSTVRGIQSQLLSAITYSISGNNGFVNLASIGLNLNNDGTISVDTSTLDSALANNTSSVQNLMQGTAGFATSMSNILNLITDPTQGSIALDLQGMSQTSQSLTSQISDMQTSLTAQQQSLTAQYDQMQVALQELPQIQSQITQQLAGLGLNHNEIATLYRETSARGNQPVALVVKLYDAILEDLRRAMNAAEAANAQERTASLNHALLIIAELQSVLDHGEGREVATRLEGFYNVTRGLIIEANIRSSPEQLQKIIDLYLPLRQAWKQVEVETSTGNTTFSEPAKNNSNAGEFANASTQDSGPDQERAQWNA